jgi:site-specific DNA recombinase
MTDILINDDVILQYYVEDSHPAIVSKKVFDLVQEEFSKRKERKYKMKAHPFAGKIFCAECGSYYGSKIWHSADKYHKTVWQCNAKYKQNTLCTTPSLTEEELQKAFLSAANKLLGDKREHLETLENVLNTVMDTSNLRRKLASVSVELEVVKGLVMKLNSSCMIEPIDTEKKAELKDRYEKLDKEIADLRNEITDKESRAVEIRAFMKALKSSKQLPTEFNADIWNTLGDKMTISENGTIIVTFKDGTEIKA